MNPWSLAQLNAYESQPGFVGPPRSLAAIPPAAGPALAMANQQYMAHPNGQGTFGAPPIPPNTFRQAREAQTRQNNQSTVLKDLFMSDEEYQRRVQSALESPEVQAQQKGLALLEGLNRAQAENMPVQFDYSPLQTLANFENKTNLPMPEIRKADWSKVSGFADEIQKRRADIINSVKSGIQSQRAGKITDLAALLTTNKLVDELGAKPPSGGGATTPETKFTHEWLTYSKPNREALESAQNAVATLTSGSVVGLEAFKNFMARASGEKGPLSNQDVTRFAGSQALSNQIDRAWEKYSSGRMTNSDQKDMRLLADSYVHFRRGILQNDAKYFSNQIGPLGFNVNSAKAAGITTPQSGFGIQQAPAPSSPDIPLRDQVLQKLRAGQPALQAPAAPEPAVNIPIAPIQGPPPAAQESLKDKIKALLNAGKNGR